MFDEFCKIPHIWTPIFLSFPVSLCPHPPESALNSFFDIWDGLSCSIYLHLVGTACCSLPRTLPKLPSHCQVRQTVACLHKAGTDYSSEVYRKRSNRSCGRRTHACCWGLRRQKQSERNRCLGARLVPLCLAPYLHCWGSQFYHGYDLRNLRRSINIIKDTVLP